jgi:hypothetical protein
MNSSSEILATSSTAKPNPNVLFRRLGDDIVVFHLTSDRFYELNGTAARFWELLAAGQTVSDAKRQMLDEFAVDPDQLASETETLLEMLRREDLLTVNE